MKNLEEYLKTSPEEKKIQLLIGVFKSLEIPDEDIIGMLSMLETEENIDEMIRFLVHTPELTKEKIVKALIIVVRKDVVI